MVSQQLERWAYAALIVAASIAFAVLLVANIRTNHHLHTAQTRLARLTQRLCRSVSDQRVTSNAQIRIPLQLALQADGSLYRGEALRSRSPISRSIYITYADRFDQLAQRVTILRGLPCEFEDTG